MAMSLRRMITIALAAVFLGGPASASGGGSLFPIPGVEAGRLASPGAARLDDGGAVVAFSLYDGPRQGWHLAVARLHVDGTLDLAYGDLGIARLSLGADVKATALAVDPRSGEAWLGVSNGRRRLGQVVALAGNGGLRRGFGEHGVLHLGAGNPPTALAWGGDRLLVAFGGEPCAGCSLEELDASTGAELATSRLTGGSSCSGEVSGAILLTNTSGLLARNASPGCPAQLVPVDLARGRALRFATPQSPVVSQTRYQLASFGGSLCLAGTSKAGVSFGPYNWLKGRFARSRAPAGNVVGLVALGGSACAVLISEARHAIVAQASAARPRPLITSVSRSARGLAMFRCHAHLLIIAARSDGRRSVAGIEVVRVTRGPFAGAADHPAASLVGSGCQ